MLQTVCSETVRPFFRWVIGSALLVGAVACSGGSKPGEVPANRVTVNDFESMDGWGVISPSLTTEKAHSGRYSVKVDRETEYSIGYSNPLIRVASSKIKKLHVHAWVMLGNPQAKAVIVVQVTNPAKGGEKIYWEALDVRSAAKTLNRWTEIDKDFDLPDTISSTHELRVYMWRTSPEGLVYLDDLELTKG